jgi:hypothetical protein
MPGCLHGGLLPEGCNRRVREPGHRPGRDGELLNGADSRLEKAGSLGHSKTGYEQQIPMHLYLFLTHGTAPARKITGVAPCRRLQVCHSFIDQLFQSGATAPIDRQDVREPVFAHAVVPENQADAFRGRDTEFLQLLAVGRKLQHGRDLGMAGQLGVVDLVITAGVLDDEVRVAEESPVEEGGLVHRRRSGLEGGGGELDHRRRIC